ncbi:alpha/beta hydrolase [Halobacillus litoralis]|uniref:alpha/beta fold hydrolase n=1 Tax=Halobacillus litoralis TaxID=45668 RepID=UPI001CD5B202|nr:alpha/beta hydrolase [Halobacillus litoralis]MCA0970192.1 alpha/beta hydrolase [Halobacillus litoralis]
MIESWIRKGIASVCLPLTLWNAYRNSRNRTNPPGEMIRTTESHLHTIKRGHGPATVVLEAGMSSLSIDWHLVQPALTDTATVVSYDRGNYGWSRTNRRSMSSLTAVNEMRELLKVYGLKPPYILVGHSFGSMAVRLFSSLYPEEVKALVLVDPTHEDYYIRTEENLSRIRSFERTAKLGYMMSLTGLPRLLKQGVGRSDLGKEYTAHLDYVSYKNGAFQSLYQEVKDTEISAEEVMVSRPLAKDLPVTVLSATERSPDWLKHQEKFAALTDQTEHIWVESGHSIHLEKPDIVIQSIKKYV